MTQDATVAIIGGGPAGLSAALTLARANVSSMLFDAPSPARNAASHAVGNLPGHDGIAPQALRDQIRKELGTYDLTTFRNASVQSIAEAPEGGFTLAPSDGAPVTVSRIILACGRVDLAPEIEGFATYWAKSIHNCPYCGGYDDRGTPWGIVVNRPEMVDIIEIYRMWSDDLVVFLEPGIEMTRARRADLADKGIGVEENPIRKVLGDGERMTGVALADGRTVPRHALIWWPKMVLPDLLLGLALDQNEQGDLSVDAGYHTSHRGIYATGDLIYSDHQTTATALHLGGACAASVVYDIAFPA